MKQPNPMISSGMTPDNQRRGRARMRMAVVGIVLAHVVLFAGILFNACKQDSDEEKPKTSQLPELPPLKPAQPLGPSPEAPLGPAPVTSVGPFAPPVTPPEGSVPVAPVAPTQPTLQPVAPAPPAAAAIEHVIVAGDSFYKLARKYGVGFKAIETANPGVVSTKLQIGQKIVIPPPKVPAATSLGTGAPAEPVLAANEVIIKRGDSLSVLARRHGTSVKALQEANNLTGTRILAGQKLKLPAGARLPTIPTPPAPTTAAPPTTLFVPAAGTGDDTIPVSPPPPVTTVPVSGN